MNKLPKTSENFARTFVILIAMASSAISNEAVGGECRADLPADAFVTLKNGQRLCRVITGTQLEKKDLCLVDGPEQVCGSFLEPMDSKPTFNRLLST